MGLVFFLIQAPGFASFNYGDITIEIPLVRFAIGLLIIFVVFYFILRILGLLVSAPKRIQQSTVRHKRQKAIGDTKEGLTKFILGNWEQSEKLLIRGAENADTVCVNYIWAAHAAHQSGDYKKRDDYLGMAKKCTPEAHSALNVVQSELLLDQGLPEQALATLNQQENEIRSNSKIAALFVKAYKQLNAWQKLAEIIPDLKKSKHLDKKFIYNIEKQTVQGLLNNSNSKTSSENIVDIGSKFKEVISADSDLKTAYVEALCKHGSHERAETLIAKSLDNSWNTKLVYLYGLLELDNYSHVLKNAERWAQHHTNDANLYLTLGRLCKRAKLWGKAKSYFESSISRKPLAETYAELAALHEQLDELDDANRCTKKGLKLATKVV